MPTSTQFDGYDDDTQLKNWKLRYEEFPSHRVKICESTGGGTEEQFASRRVETEQLQETQMWGRRFSNSKRSRSALGMPPSRLSRWDLEASSSCKSTAMMRVAALGIRWKASTSRWWEDFPGARIGGALRAVLWLMIATAFLGCVYLCHQGLKSRLFVTDGVSSNYSGRFDMASFLYHYSGGQTLSDMTDGIPGGFFSQ